jgi:predicted RNase H-like HicB family nuclease
VAKRTCGENEEQGGWVAHCAEYPDLSVWGDTRKAAIELLERIIAEREEPVGKSD